MRVELVDQGQQAPDPELPPLHENHPDGAAFPNPGAGVSGSERNPDDPDSWGKVGRNESCPCGSGKKFKHCHGSFN